MRAISSGRQIPRESVTRWFNLRRNRDRQCRCFTRCSTSMTIAGNFARSVCVLSRLSPPSSAYPSQPVLIHIAIHPPCIPLSRRSWTLHSILAGSEFVRGGNLFSVTSRRCRCRCRAGRRAFGAPVFRTHASCRNLSWPGQWGSGLRCPEKKRANRRICLFLSFPFSASPRLASFFL